MSRAAPFTLAGLLVLVALLALAMAAVRSASVLWTTAATTFALAVLLAAPLAAVYARGGERAFWVGFTLFGWVYLILVNWSWLGAQVGHDLTGGLRELAEAWLPFDETQPFASPADRTEKQLQHAIRLGNVSQIGRLILTLLFALLGGVVSRSLAGREPSR